MAFTTRNTEIAGDSVLFETFDSKEEEKAARLEANRRTAWQNALVFAEQLWRAVPHHEYVVSFRTKTRTSARKWFAFTDACYLIRRNGGVLYGCLPPVRA